MKLLKGILLIFIIASVLFSATTGKITGIVKDVRTGEPLAGANVIIEGTSMGAATNACIMAQPRLQYSIARDGLFFKSFAYLHPKYGTPSKSIIFQSGAAIILIFIGGIESLLGYFTFAFLFQNILIFGSIFWLKKRKDYNPTYKAPMWKTMVIFSLIIQPILIIATFQVFPFKGVIIASAITALGLPAYLFFKNYEFDGMRIRKVRRKLATNKN